MTFAFGVLGASVALIFIFAAYTIGHENGVGRAARILRALKNGRQAYGAALKEECRLGSSPYAILHQLEDEGFLASDPEPLCPDRVARGLYQRRLYRLAGELRCGAVHPTQPTWICDRRPGHQDNHHVLSPQGRNFGWPEAK